MPLCFILFFNSRGCSAETKPWINRGVMGEQWINLILLQTNKLNIWIAAVVGLFVLWHSWWTCSGCIFRERRQDNLLGLQWNSTTFWRLLCCASPYVAVVKLPWGDGRRPLSLCFRSGFFLLKAKEKGERVKEWPRGLAWELEHFCPDFSNWKIEGKCCEFLTDLGGGEHSYFGNSTVFPS